MSAGTLHIYDTAHPGAHRALRILVTAALAGLKVDLADGYEHGKTNKTPEFLAKFPTGQVPAFETPSGETFSEGSAIALYLALSASSSSKLPPPASNAEQAQIAQWQGFVDFLVLQNLIFVYGSKAGFNPGAAPELVQRKLDTAIDALRKIDEHLASRGGASAYLVGDKLSLGDIAVVSGLVRGYQGVFDAEVQEKYPTVTAYTKRILAIPEVKATYEKYGGGEVKFAAKSPLKE